ncbi:putative major facilitator superfamily, MFS transporter superfamily [Septoria linicola]|nr:putative major facilitator superfamily, MFS transporter superfamily [Septoria linicola]
MHHSTSPSDAERPHIDTTAASHTRHVQFRRDSRPSVTLDEARRTSISKPHPNGGRVRYSADIKNDDLTEQSPLLPPRTSEDDGELPYLPGIFSPDQSSNKSWDAEEGAHEESKSSWYLLALTVAFGGLQIAWSVELSNGSPYLLSLGITKSLLAFVWIAGPLSGTLVQPYVGIKSDRCRSRFGKRRPFMVGGAIATIVSLMVLAWTREIVGTFLAIFGVARDSEATKTVAIVLAVLMVYVLDFSINVIQAGLRAFVVDNAPTHQQDTANAWASRLLGIGNIVGYLFGYANLPKYLWFFGDTQFKVLCVIASIGLGSTLAISCFCISERDPRSEGEPAKQDSGVIAFFKELWRSVRRLPPQIKAVCVVQLAAWIAWFPFLFYITTYIGDLYVDGQLRANPNMTDKDIDDAYEHGTRVGTFALLIFALVSFASSVILPSIITSSYKAPEPQPRTPMTASPMMARTPRTPRGDDTDESGYFDIRPSTPVRPTTPNGGAAFFGDSSFAKSTSSRGWLSRTKRRVPSLEIKWLTLKRAWLLSHVLFALLTGLTFVVNNTTSAIIVAGLIGIPWSMTMWAPFALIASEVSKRDNIRRGRIAPPPTRDGDLLARGEDDAADQAGVVLGIHNVAVAAPQVIATLVSSAIFKALQKPRGTVGDDSVAWVLRFGGVLALIAAWLTRRVREEGDEDDKPRW